MNEVKDLKKYLKDALGVETELKPLAPDKLKTLPIFIVNEYDFHLTELYRQDILFVFVKNSFTTERLKKHLDIIKANYNIKTVAVIKQLEAYNRLRLIEKKVPFIIPGKQMYLPDLLIDLKEFGIKVKEQSVAMQPAAQLLLMYHLQVGSLEGTNLKGIAEMLNYNAMTITRAVYYLHNAGLCAIQGTKDKFLHFNKNRRELWDRAVPLMSNPVKKATYFAGWTSGDNMYKANINALAFYTNLNDDVIGYFAVKPGYTQRIGGANLKITGPLEGNICIEEWKYNPYLLTMTEFVDPLSLYLCFRNNLDERIEMAVGQIIDKFKW